MPFTLTKNDFGLTDGKKAHAIKLRERMLELYRELVPKLENEKALKNYVEFSSPKNGLHTITPYVSNYYVRTGGIRRNTWIGFADKTKYQDPRAGVQYQFGIRREDNYWFGLWIQGDQKTRPVHRALHQILMKYTLDQITDSINGLGHSYWVKVIRDNDDEIIIDNYADKVTINQIKEFRDNLEKKRLWISIDKIFKNHTKNDLLLIKDVPEEIMKTTLELLPIVNWWSGTSIRETPPEEAYSILKNGGMLKIIDEDSGSIFTGEREAIVSSRVGQNIVRRATLENYQHRCALCDMQGDDFLVASHILTWASDRENRGNLSNVLCLCSLHDFLFERGKLRITPELKVEFSEEMMSSSRESIMLRAIIENTGNTLRKPIAIQPDSQLLKKKLDVR